MEADGKVQALRPSGAQSGAIRPFLLANFRPHPEALVAMARGFRVAACSPVCFRALATVTVLVGVFGQMVDVLHRSNGDVLRGWHTEFGVVLLLALMSRVFRAGAGEAGLESIDAHRLQRTLKRLVYLLFYFLALVRELLVVGYYIWRGGAITLGSIVIGRHVTDNTVTIRMSDDFGIYIIYAVAALIFIPMASGLRSRMDLV